MRSLEFEASLAEARHYPQLWRLILGSLLAILLWFAVGLVVLGIAAGIVAGTYSLQGHDPMLVSGWFTGLVVANEPGHVLTLLATFLGLFIGALVAPAALHFRGPDSLFGPWLDWRRGFLIALAVLAPIYALVTAAGFFLGGAEPNMELGQWALLLAPTLILLLIQTGAEEMFFRGYLQQQLAARYTARWVWMGIPSLLFAALHWTPEAGQNLPVILFSTFIFALVAADLTERTGNLGAAMGLHFGNNVVALTVIGPKDMMSGMALYTSPVGLAESSPVLMGLSIPVLVLTWWCIRRALDS